MVLSAQSIDARCVSGPGRIPMVHPFSRRKEIFWNPDKQEWSGDGPARRLLYPSEKRYSYGLSACGYDVRIAEDVWLWPGYGRLASTVERFYMPDDVMAEVKDKSSWARQFITIQNTVIEPGWHGYLTLELTNHRPVPRYVRRGTPIAQIIFYELDKATIQPYDGKYQNQASGPQKAR